MRSLCYCIYFTLCVLTARGQELYGGDSIINGQFIQAAFSTPLLNRLEMQRAGDEHLPVVYKSLHVKRLRSKVDLVWETSFECNNSGFEIQRKLGDSEWQKVAFVFSQAADGNSNGALTYEFTDVNTGKEKSQYRLKQIDLDRSIMYSEVRSIGGY